MVLKSLSTHWFPKRVHWRYEHTISVMLASTSLQGEYKNSIRRGFRTIANYIFGGNQEEQKIAMTAPVLVENPNASQYTMAFVMPTESVKQGLLTPDIQIFEITNTTMGHRCSMVFRRMATERRINKEWDRMQEALANTNIQAEQYDWIASVQPPIYATTISSQ